MKCHDPRLSDDRDEKIETNNGALMQAETIRQNWPHLDILWDRVATAANECDEWLSAADYPGHGRIVRAGWDVIMQRHMVNPDAKHPDEALLMQDNCPS